LSSVLQVTLAQVLRSAGRLFERLRHVARVVLRIAFWTATLQLPSGLRRLRTAWLIRRSGLFQPDYYLGQLPRSEAAPRDLVWHYVVEGAAAVLDPNPLFHTRSYLEQHPDVRSSGTNPLAHYIAHAEEAVRPLERDRSAAVPFAPASRMSSPRPLLAAICHLFHPELAPEFQRYLANIPFPCDLFLTTDTRSKMATLQEQFRGWPHGGVEVRLCDNRGRDIAPKLVALRDVHERYEYVLHLHSKRSPHQSVLAPWRGYLLETLVGSGSIVRSVFQAFAEDPHLGIVAAQHFEPICPWVAWGANLARATTLASRMGFRIDGAGALDFPSGSMFWARSEALGPLLDLRLSFDDFEVEEGQYDGTLAHTIERLFFFVCERAGYSWTKIARKEMCPNTRGIVEIGSLEALRRHLSEDGFSLTGRVSLPIASP